MHILILLKKTINNNSTIGSPGQLIPASCIHFIPFLRHHKTPVDEVPFQPNSTQ